MKTAEEEKINEKIHRDDLRKAVRLNERFEEVWECIENAQKAYPCSLSVITNKKTIHLELDREKLIEFLNQHAQEIRAELHSLGVWG